MRVENRRLVRAGAGSCGRCQMRDAWPSFRAFNFNNEGISAMGNLYRNCRPLIMRFRLRHAMAIAALFFGAISSRSAKAASEPDGYPALVKLFQQWREFGRPVMKNNVPHYNAS